MAIPMPDLPGNALLNGIKTGGNLFTQMMGPRLHRENMQRQWQQHLDEMALRKAAAARAGANSDIQRQILEQQLLGLQHKNDPSYELNQFKSLQDMIMGGGQGGAMPESQEPQPTQEMGEGMGMFSPEGFNQTQNTLQPQSASGFNLEALKQNPLLRGFFKHKFGVDPLAQAPQTPEEKQAAALETFRQKEAIKASNKATGATGLTAPIKTKYQSVIGGARSALPIIDKIIEETKKGNIPGQMFGAIFKPDAQANYKGEISTLLDGIRNAYTIPNTDSGTSKAEDKVLRKNGESDGNYIKRLETIRQQIVDRESDARAKLSTGNITSQVDNYSHLSDEELHKIAAGGG